MSVRSTTWILDITIPAGTRAYSPVRATIIIPESGAAMSEYQTERPVIIEDAYVVSTSSVDYLVRVVINREKVAGVTRASANLLIATNPAKPKAFEPSIGVLKDRFITFEVLPLADVTSAVTHRMFISVTLLPGA